MNNTIFFVITYFIVSFLYQLLSCPSNLVIKIALDDTISVNTPKCITTSAILGKPFHEIIALATKNTWYISASSHASFELTSNNFSLQILPYSVPDNTHVLSDTNSFPMLLDMQQLQSQLAIDKLVLTEYLNKNGIFYKTEITPVTTIDQITDQRLLENTKIRRISQLSKAAVVSLVIIKDQLKNSSDFKRMKDQLLAELKEANIPYRQAETLEDQKLTAYNILLNNYFAVTKNIPEKGRVFELESTLLIENE